MAKTSQEQVLVVLLVHFLILFSSFSSLHARTEVELLLSFKASIKDPFNVLSSWTNITAVPAFCGWSGVVCDRNKSHVVSINLSGKNISGEISSSSVFQLPFVETVDLSTNKFSGVLPRDLFTSSSSSLRFLNLSDNNFTGPIPRGVIPGLETLDMSNNMLSGRIPDEIGSFSTLKFLDLGGNVLAGEIPASMTKLTRLNYFTLASNQLTGAIPRGFGSIKSLKWIYFGYNNFSGQIPEELGGLASLSHLDLVYNNLSGPIPSSLGNLSELQHLFLYQNKLSGPIPKSIFSLPKIVSLDLSDNSLFGEIPEIADDQLQNLEILHLFSNNLTGKIPDGLSRLSRLRVLQLWSNKLSGEIPRSLGRRNNFTVLDLSTNKLTGEVPETLCYSGQLFKLILFSNSLQGDIPQRLGACKSLKRVRLQNNHLSGEIPRGFTQLPLVYFLDLSNNSLGGEIGDREWEMPSLQMLNLRANNFSGHLPASFGSKKIENLDLSRNGFTGIVPHEFGELTELMELNLRGNQLTGEIPSELSSCKKLVSLDLSRNKLSGKIPSSLSDLPVLGNLDVSLNQLSGEIPRDLGKVESLVQVNISYNRLHGSLPLTGVFLAINSSSVTGNDGLCGGNYDHNHENDLPPCRKRGDNKVLADAWQFVLLSCIVLAFLILILVGFFALRTKRKNSLSLKQVEKEEGTWEIQFFDQKASKILTIDDVLSTAKEENVISRSKDGVLYKSGPPRTGMRFVVRQMMNQYPVSSSNLSFWPAITEFGKRSRHPNVTRLLGACRSEKAAYLIYEHVEGKRLSENIVWGFSWERRRKILMGVAKALRFLHLGCAKSFVVGDMSPERILLDQHDEPHLCLSLTHHNLLFTEGKSLASSSSYLAPETRTTKETTEKSDVYGFGLILIEFLTGKGPGDATLGKDRSLVDWARYCYSDCHLDTWLDPIVRESSHHNQNEFVEMMNLALQCTAADPKARPSSGDICKTLELTCGTSYCSFGLEKLPHV